MWKTYCEDEGVRAIVNFIQLSLSTLCLEFLDCKVTPLGCEFIGKMLTPGPKCPPLAVLKLDHNPIGSDGVIALAEGLKANENLKILSLAYCDIDQRGGRPLLEILIFQKSRV